MNDLDDVKNGLFLIVGCSRSGTTLLRAILNAHPELFVAPETLFFKSIADRFSDDPVPLDRMIQSTISKWWIRDMAVDEASLRQRMQNQPANWQTMFLALLAVLSGESTAKAFGEKTVEHIVHAEAFLETYPTCKVIQVIRDPRAVLASLQKANVRSKQVFGVVAEWQRAIRLHEKLKHHDRYVGIHFEQLIRDPESVLSDVCRHLGVDYDARMLKFHEREAADFSPEQVHHENTRKPIFLDGLEKWKSDLSHSQIALLEYGLAAEMTAAGYALTGASVSCPSMRLKLSRLKMQASRQLIRRPRQLVKALKARKRQIKAS